MRYVVLVHPGSHFTSGASQVSDIIHNEVTLGLVEDLQSAEGLIVIDGALSDGIPDWFEAEISAALERCDKAREPSFRIWGCDSGEKPYKGWTHYGPDRRVFSGQEEAATAMWVFLPMGHEIIVTGAWATRDGSSGCVNSVADALRATPLQGRVIVSENALYEEYMEDRDIEP